jgi:hypothetical protein
MVFSMKMDLQNITGMLILLLLSGPGLKAQEAFTTTGGSASGGEGSVSYSVGQVFYDAFRTSGGKLFHGVQQPYEFLTGDGPVEVPWIGLSVAAYPNPARDHLVLSVEREVPGTLSYGLYDMSGKLIERSGIDASQVYIDMSGLSPSEYILVIAASDKKIKSFKIIKN